MKSSKQIDLETRLEMPFLELDSSELMLLIGKYKLECTKHRLMKVVRASAVPLMSNIVYEVIHKDSSRESTPDTNRIRLEEQKAAKATPHKAGLRPNSTSKENLILDPISEPAKKSPVSKKPSSKKARLQNAIKARMKQSSQKQMPIEESSVKKP